MGHFTTEMSTLQPRYTEMGHFATQTGHFTTDVTYAVGPPQRKQMACFLAYAGMDPQDEASQGYSRAPKKTKNVITSSEKF